MGRIRAVVRGGDPGDDAAVSVRDAVLRNNRDRARADWVESRLFKDQLIGGIGWRVHHWDPINRLLRYQYVPPMDVVWDDRAMDINLQDRQWSCVGRFLRLDVFESLWGHTENGGRIVRDLSTLGHIQGQEERAWPWSYLQEARVYDREAEEIWIVEEEVRETLVTGFVIQNLTDGSTIQSLELAEDGEADPADLSRQLAREAEEIADAASAQGARPIIHSVPKEVVFHRVWAGNELLAENTRPHFMLQAVCGYPALRSVVPQYYERMDNGLTPHYARSRGVDSANRWDWMSLVDLMVDDQLLRSKYTQAAILWALTSPKGFAIDPEAFVGTSDEIMDQLMSPDKVLELKPGRSAKQAIEEFGGSMPTAMPQILQMLSESQQMAAGIAQFDLAGQADLRRISGDAVEAMRQSMGARHAMWFESLRAYRRLDAEIATGLLVDERLLTNAEIAQIAGNDEFSAALQVSAPPEALQGLSGPLGQMADTLESQGFPMAYRDTSKFDIDIDEAPITDSERRRRWEVLMGNEHGGMDLLQSAVGPQWLLENNPNWTAGERKSLIEAFRRHQPVMAALTAAQGNQAGEALLQMLPQILGDEQSAAVLMQMIQQLMQQQAA